MLASAASMSSTLNERSTYQPDFIIDPAKLTLNRTVASPAENVHLSPYSNRNYNSTTASPSLHNHSTPGELVSENGYSVSDLSDYDDEFFGVDFDAGGRGAEIIPAAPDLPSPTDNNYIITAGINNIQIKHTSASTIYTHPLSPVDTEAPSRQSSMRSDFEGLRIQTPIPNHELDMDFGISPKSYETPAGRSIPGASANPNPTPDRSNSSQGSLGSLGYASQSPRVTVSQWGVTADPGPPNGPKGLGLQELNLTVGGYSEDEERAGLSPSARKLLGGAEVPNFREQDLLNRIETKNAEILSWRTRAASIGGDGPSHQQSSGLNDVSAGNRPRAKSTGAMDDSHDHDPMSLDETPVVLPPDEQYMPPADGWDSRPASPRENKLIEGQLYFNPNATAGTGEVDLKLIGDAPRQWCDAPALPYITQSRVQPPTANAAMARFNIDNFSQASRAATWGTRRKSEPSVADMELFTDGGFLKKLSISRGKKDDKPRQGSIFSKLSKRNHSFTQKERFGINGSPLKQKNDSSSSLAPPSRTSSFGKKTTPSLNTAMAAMAGSAAAIGGAGHARSGSFSRTGSFSTPPTNPQQNVSPKSPFGFVGTALKRARSKSDLPRLGIDVSSQQPGIAELWKGLNGPPVPMLSSPGIDLDAPMASEQVENEEDEEEDEQVEDYETKVDFGSPIVATKEGFQAHVRELNPDMQHQFLIERIAHQQMVRYKNLLNIKVKHVQAVRSRDCSSEKHCLALGGSVTLLDSKNASRKTSNATTSFQAAGDSEDESLPEEGLITPETFPPGVPMPPTQYLPAEFECPLCFKVKKFQKPSDWTKHVHEDVQPFTCTYANCKEPKSFKRKADWVRHENERHRHLEWWTCQFEDCTHRCYRKDNFLQHLVREHKLPEPKQKTKAAVKKAHGVEEVVWQMLRDCHHDTQNRPHDEPCKFCGKQLTSWKKLTVHLAKHMEHISLPILNLVEQKPVDSDTIISPVEPQPVARGSFTPNLMTKQESQTSNHFSDNISPGMPASGFPYYYPTPTSATHPQSLNFSMAAPMSAQEAEYHTSSMYSNAYAQPQMQSQMQPQMQAAVFTPLSGTPVAQQFQSHIANQTYGSYQVTNGQSLDQGQAFVGLGVSNAAMPNFQQSSQMLGAPDAAYGFQQTGGPALDYSQMAPSRMRQGSAASYHHSQTSSPQPQFPQCHATNQYTFHGR